MLNHRSEANLQEIRSRKKEGSTSNTPSFCVGANPIVPHEETSQCASGNTTHKERPDVNIAAGVADSLQPKGVFQCSYDCHS